MICWQPKEIVFETAGNIGGKTEEMDGSKANSRVVPRNAIGAGKRQPWM